MRVVYGELDCHSGDWASRKPMSRGGGGLQRTYDIELI